MSTLGGRFHPHLRHLRKQHLHRSVRGMEKLAIAVEMLRTNLPSVTAIYLFVYASDPRNLQIITKQDSIILNIQRACEAAIDLAMHLVRWYRLGIPQESRGAFQLLVNAGRLPPSLGETMTRMVGFRNIAMHDYRKLDLRIVQAIIENKLEDLLAFASHAIKSES